MIKSFRDLDVWKKGMGIAKLIYQFTAQLPAEERFGLIVQMRRAAVSLPSNVAEGFRRRNQKEFIQYLHIALGSAAELETQIELCHELHKTDQAEFDNMLDATDHFQAMAMSLIKELRVTHNA